MEYKDIEKKLKSSDYDFLRTNPLLKDKIILLTLGGSHAYGTSIPESDLDIRGCALNSITDLIGLSNFEQFENHVNDTVIFSFNKLVNLLTNCNPNVIEILGCKPEHYYIVTDEGKQLIENKKIFLSQRAVKSFGGYANQQLRRLQNALARDEYPQPEKEKHILNSIKSTIQSFDDRYAEFDKSKINLYIDKSEQEDMENEIYVDVDLKHYPLRDYKNIWSEINEIVNTYGKLNKRNNKKDDIHLCKHACHLIRLHLMCIDILEKEEIITFREADHDLIMSIRNGEYQKSDSTFIPEFWEMVNDLERKMLYAAKNTSLPKEPNYKKIEEFMIDVNKRILK